MGLARLSGLRALSTAAAMVLLTLLGGCTRGCSSRLNYADDPNLEAAKARFGCTRPSNDLAREACAAITEFEGGGAVASYPSQGSTFYLGRSICVDGDVEVEDGSVVIEVLTLSAGMTSLEVDETHRPGGTLSVSMHAFARTTPLHPIPIDGAVARTLDALRRGDATYETGLQDGRPFPKDFLEWRHRATVGIARTAHQTANSDGKSLLDPPGRIGAFWDDFDRSSATHFVREVEGGLVRLSPVDHVCVTRFYKLP